VEGFVGLIASLSMTATDVWKDRAIFWVGEFTLLMVAFVDSDEEG
jgi:hypothetical protein